MSLVVLVTCRPIGRLMVPATTTFPSSSSHIQEKAPVAVAMHLFRPISLEIKFPETLPFTLSPRLPAFHLLDLRHGTPQTVDHPTWDSLPDKKTPWLPQNLPRCLHLHLFVDFQLQNQSQPELQQLRRHRSVGVLPQQASSLIIRKSKLLCRSTRNSRGGHCKSRLEEFGSLKERPRLCLVKVLQRTS